jgi:hypothetical protein
MLRRVVFALICGGLLAGTAVAAGDPREPKKRHNAPDQAWAEAIRVQRSDLGSGDWRVEMSNHDDRGAPKGCRDPNLSDLVETGSAEQPDWSRKGSFVMSGSVVFQSERQLATAWQRFTPIDLTGCLGWAFKQGAASSGVTVTVTSSGPVRIAKLAPRWRTGRITLTVRGPAAAIKGRMSYYFAARGRASVILMVASFGKPATRISDALEQRLARAVTQRLKR